MITSVFDLQCPNLCIDTFTNTFRDLYFVCSYNFDSIASMRNVTGLVRLFWWSGSYEYSHHEHLLQNNFAIWFIYNHNNDGIVFVCEILENPTLDRVTINSLPIWFIYVYYNKVIIIIVYGPYSDDIYSSKCSHTKAIRLL